jgi:transcription elongation GreA/GreB family factor
LTSLKYQLHSYCVAYIHERITAAQVAIQTAQLSANEETKSSAGDKYETGRAMAQLEIENNSAQLAESIRLKQVLEQISFDQATTSVQMGSVVITNQGNFYIAISAGQFVIEGKTYFAISTASPIGQKLIGLSVEASFTFNQKEYLITQIL